MNGSQCEEINLRPGDSAIYIQFMQYIDYSSISPILCII